MIPTNRLPPQTLTAQAAPQQAQPSPMAIPTVPRVQPSPMAPRVSDTPGIPLMRRAAARAPGGTPQPGTPGYFTTPQPGTDPRAPVVARAPAAPSAFRERLTPAQLRAITAGGAVNSGRIAARNAAPKVVQDPAERLAQAKASHAATYTPEMRKKLHAAGQARQAKLKTMRR